MNILSQVLSKRSLTVVLLLATASISLVGCDSGELKSVIDNADAQAIADYERMVAEAEEKANSQNSN